MGDYYLCLKYQYYLALNPLKLGKYNLIKYKLTTNKPQFLFHESNKGINQNRSLNTVFSILK